MIDKVGRLPAHWPLCLVQAMDLHDDDDYRPRNHLKIGNYIT